MYLTNGGYATPQMNVIVFDEVDVNCDMLPGSMGAEVVNPGGGKMDNIEICNYHEICGFDDDFPGID